jgi:hypothetical protein
MSERWTIRIDAETKVRLEDLQKKHAFTQEQLFRHVANRNFEGGEAETHKASNSNSELLEIKNILLKMESKGGWDNELEAMAKLAKYVPEMRVISEAIKDAKKAVIESANRASEPFQKLAKEQWDMVKRREEDLERYCLHNQEYIQASQKLLQQVDSEIKRTRIIGSELRSEIQRTVIKGLQEKSGQVQQEMEQFGRDNKTFMKWAGFFAVVAILLSGFTSFRAYRDQDNVRQSNEYLLEYSRRVNARICSDSWKMKDLRSSYCKG